jgi:hypothetical protein
MATTITASPSSRKKMPYGNRRISAPRVSRYTMGCARDKPHYPGPRTCASVSLQLSPTGPSRSRASRRSSRSLRCSSVSGNASGSRPSTSHNSSRSCSCSSRDSAATFTAGRAMANSMPRSARSPADGQFVAIVAPLGCAQGRAQPPPRKISCRTAGRPQRDIDAKPRACGAGPDTGREARRSWALLGGLEHELVVVVRHVARGDPPPHAPTANEHAINEAMLNPRSPPALRSRSCPRSST